jgi:hypothetical protein
MGFGISRFCYTQPIKRNPCALAEHSFPFIDANGAAGFGGVEAFRAIDSDLMAMISNAFERLADSDPCPHEPYDEPTELGRFDCDQEGRFLHQFSEERQTCRPQGCLFRDEIHRILLSFPRF